MATGPLYSNILVNDNSFYIIKNTNQSLSDGALFDATNISGLITLTLHNSSGTLALDSAGGVSTVSANNIIPANQSVYITTTSGSLSISSTASNLQIFSQGSSAVYMQNNTQYYQINKTFTSGTSQELWLGDNLVDGGTSYAFFISSRFSVINGISQFASGYEASTVYYYDGTSLSFSGGVDKISRGNNVGGVSGTGGTEAVDFAIFSNLPQLKFTPTSDVSNTIKGLVTVTVSDI